MTKLILRFFIIVGLWAFLPACDNPANDVSHYTAVDKNDTVHSSGGLATTKRGEELFIQRCSACHGVSGNAQNNKALNLQWTKLDSLGIATTIRNGRGTMPMFSIGVLGDSDVAQIEMYVRMMRK